jgi:hypothetical protein
MSQDQRTRVQAMSGAASIFAGGGSVPVPPDTGLPPAMPPMAPPPAPVDDPSPAATPPAPVGEPPRDRSPAACRIT